MPSELKPGSIWNLNIGSDCVTLIHYKIAAALLIFLVSFIFAYYPLKKHKTLVHSESVELGEALASGIFLGSAFFHLLPDAAQQFNSLYPDMVIPLAEMICVSGFLLLLFLERLSLNYSFPQQRNTVPYILILMLVIHALTEGAALGVGSNFSATIMLIIAILAHKGSESYALVMTLLRHTLSRRLIMTIAILFSFMTPVGILFGNFINDLGMANRGVLAAACFNAFAAGTFLYISTLHHIHFHQHAGNDKQGLLEFGSLAFGVLIMGLISFAAI